MSRSCQSRSCCLLDVLEIVIDSVMDPTFHMTTSHNSWWTSSCCSCLQALNTPSMSAQFHCCAFSHDDQFQGLQSNCNALIRLQLAMHRASSCGTHRVVTHSRKMRFSVHGTSCAAGPVFCNGEEACSEEQGTIVTRCWSACCNGHIFQTVATTHMQRNTFCSVSFQHGLSLQNEVMTNCTTGTPILHAEPSFNSAERGLRRGSRAEPLSNVTFILASF